MFKATLAIEAKEMHHVVKYGPCAVQEFLGVHSNMQYSTIVSIKRPQTI
jgi:hypothetical protein